MLVTMVFDAKTMLIMMIQHAITMLIPMVFDAKTIGILLLHGLIGLDKPYVHDFFIVHVWTYVQKNVTRTSL
jgi:hypothetical protein